MRIALYVSRGRDGAIKPREQAIADALAAGFREHGDTVEVFRTEDFAEPRDGVQLAATIGIKGHSKAIFDSHRRSGRHALLIDKSYIGRSEYLRLSLDGFQPHYAHAKPRPHDRLERAGLRLAPRRGGRGRYVIYAGSSQKYCDWHGLGDATAFAEGVCHRINKAFGTGDERPSLMPLLYRPKPSWVAGHPEDAKPIRATTFSGPDVKLGELLGNCHALVTHGSNAAVEAVIAGVPAVVVSRGACAAEPVAELDLDTGIWNPRFPNDEERRQWLANLAYCQFTLEEIASGFAWSTLQHLTIKPLEGRLAAMDQTDAVIEQYRIMHQSPKMFRGRLADVFAAEIGALYRELKCEHWLDYGCGKGLQYSEARIHETWNLPMPALYDPGVPALAKKPRQVFDAVACLDVLEHIPEEAVDATLAEIFGYARKFAFFVIFTAPARKSLPDGRNCHLTVRPEAWWRERLEAAARGKTYVAHFKGADE